MEIGLYTFEFGSEKIEVPFDNDAAYINATDVYQKFGKPKQSFDSWKTRTLLPYAQRLIELGKFQSPQNAVSGNNQLVTLDDLIIIRRGGRAGMEAVEQGTWLHPKLAIVFARWISLDFEIWCDEKIQELLANGVTTILPQDQKWINYVEDMFDNTIGGKRFMEKVEKALLIHEEEGYNIKAFKDMIDIIRANTTQEEQTKVFKKLRLLLKRLYNEGKLGRTTAEEMTDYCTDTIVDVLEKEIKHQKLKYTRFEARVTKLIDQEPATPTVADQTTALKKEHDSNIKEAKKVIDAQSLYAHKLFGLDINGPKVPYFYFGDIKHPVADCKVSIISAGYKLVMSDTLYAKSYDAKAGSPDYKKTEFGTRNQIAIWLNTNSTASCKFQKEIFDDCGNKIYKPVLDLVLTNVNEDPMFFAGLNKEGTICVTLSTRTGYFMVYGTAADEK